MAQYDHLIVGSGINGLVCAALLAKAGKRVCVVERNARPGGCILTDEITAPGFRHDLLSSWYPLFVTSPAFQSLGEDLARHGVEFAYTDTPTAGLTGSGEAFVLHRSRERVCNDLGPDAATRYSAAMAEIEDNAELVFALLSQQLQRWRFAVLLLKCARRMGLRGLRQFARDALGSARHWLGNAGDNRAYQACVAPWVLHVGLGPDSPSSALMAKVVLFTLEAVGLPVVRGGSDRLVTGFQALIEEHGGRIQCNAQVEGIAVSGGRARGVHLADGSFIEASNVICSVTPQQLYGQLLPPEVVPETLARQAAGYRFGRADMQIHIALSAPAQWQQSELDRVAMIHLCDGTDALARAVTEADNGLLPARATVVVGQPCAVDPSRAPAGQWILWIQLQELPAHVLGDAAGEIDTPDDGCWNEALKQAYAERILARLRAHIVNLDRDMLAHTVLSPADLQQLNCNLVGGDPYCGDCALDQNLLFRPLSGTRNHDTCVDNVYHIGAATHPGPGLGGGSGYLVAQQLL